MTDSFKMYVCRVCKRGVEDDPCVLVLSGDTLGGPSYCPLFSEDAGARWELVDLDPIVSGR